MKKIVIGIALGFGANRLFKSKSVRKFLRRKSARIVDTAIVAVINVFERNGMTDDEFSKLNTNVTSILDIIQRRSKKSA